MNKPRSRMAPWRCLVSWPRECLEVRWRCTVACIRMSCSMTCVCVCMSPWSTAGGYDALYAVILSGVNGATRAAVGEFWSETSG